MTYPVRPVRHAVVPATEVKERAGVLAVLSSTSRSGEWTVPRHMRVAACFGNAELDLREARIAEGETVIEVFVLFGNVEFLFPPGVRLLVEGDTLVASFSIVPDNTIPLPPDAPTIRVVGSAYLGNVEGEVRFPDEGKRDARKRVRAATRSR